MKKSLSLFHERHQVERQEQHNDVMSNASSSNDVSRKSRSVTPSTTETRKHINIVLLGKAGVGKSSFGNFLFNSPETFAIKPTKKCQLNELETGPVTVRVLDTPGLLGLETDSVSALREVGVEIMRNIGFVHAFVLILRADTFMSREDIDCFNIYKAFFGEIFKKHCLVAFSRADNLKRDLSKYSLTSEDYFRSAPQRLRNLLEEVGARFLFFGMSSDSVEFRQERDSLLTFLEKMSKNPYKREYLYQQKQNFLNEMRRKETEWRDELKKKAADKRAKENKRELELRDEMMRRVAHAALHEREISTKVYRLVDDEQARIQDTDACSIM